jgi:addiction module HigA family antidote
MAANEFAPVTPGEMLKEEFLGEYGLSQNQLAKAIGVSPNRIAEIVNNWRRITADTALRLALYFGNSPRVLAQPADPLRTQDGAPQPAPGGRRADQGGEGRVDTPWEDRLSAPTAPPEAVPVVIEFLPLR